jgi:hypothetical protein
MYQKQREKMPKSTATYWYVLAPENSHKWKSIPGTSGMLEEFTLAIDEETGDLQD